MKTLLLLIALLGMERLYAQSSAKIQQWQSSHPELLLMSQSSYDQLSKDLQVKLKDKIVIFDENQPIESLNVTKATPYTQQEIQEHRVDTDFIKQWLGAHPEVKVVPRSIYESATPEVQQIYRDNHCLILSGETIQKQDILNF